MSAGTAGVDALAPLAPAAGGTFDLAAVVDEILSRRSAVGLAVAVVRNGHLEQFEGRGFADIPARTPTTEDTVFRSARSPRPSLRSR